MERGGEMGFVNSGIGDGEKEVCREGGEDEAAGRCGSAVL